MPRIIGTLMSHDKATLDQLRTVYSVEDAYLMLEVIMVDIHNKKIVDKFYEAKSKG